MQSRWLLHFFGDPFRAVMLTTLLLVAAAGTYVWNHSRGESTGSRQERLLSCALVFSSDGNFQPSYDDSILGRFFAPVKIVEIKERISAKAAEARRLTGIERRQLLEPLRQFADRGLSELGPLDILTHPPADDPTGVWTGINLSEIGRWLASHCRKFIPEKRPELRDYLAAVDRQLEREETRRRRLQHELRALDSNLSFDWLRIEDCLWVLEVIGWTVFGFLANTLITLFKHCRQGTYSADEYLLIFPKLVLAPLLSVVAIALWVSGISDAPINYLNLPIFLLLSFSLGFCTEQLYVKLKEITDWFLDRFARISEERVAELAQNVPYAFVNPPPPPDAPTPANLRELRARAEATVKAGFERGTVSKLSRLS